MTDENRVPADAGAEKSATEPEQAQPVVQAAAEEPEAVPVKKCRQWVTLRGSSMDARVGRGISAEVAHDLRSVVGRPHACALLHAADVPAEALAEIHRGLSDQGFDVLVAELPAGEACCDLAHAQAVASELARMHVTSDDLVVAVGHAPELALASYVCRDWCGQTSCALVPCDLASAVTCGVTPMGLAVDGDPLRPGRRRRLPTPRGSRAIPPGRRC